MARVPNALTRAMQDDMPVADEPSDATIYRIDPNTKIPVSKHYGKLWEGRIKTQTKNRQSHVDAWDEAIKYFNNSQDQYRTSQDNRSGNIYFAKRRNNAWSETENIVYANTSSLVPALYNKNPSIEYTTQSEAMAEGVQLAEDLVNKLAEMDYAPGLNLKVHAKQAVLTTELCNLSWIEYGYTERSQSVEEAHQTLEDKAQQLADAKDVKEIQRIEGELAALEETIAVATPAGPWVRFHPPHAVVSGDCSMPDFSDCMWHAIACYYPTDYLNARYGIRNTDGTYQSLYEPTHVLCATDDATASEIATFKLFDTNSDASTYGYDTQYQLEKARRTKCWRIWDKSTRRCYLYADNKWDYPCWVEADPYGLPWFYPIKPLYFNSTPVSQYARGNVTYYLDQQDGINEIHDEFRRARLDAKDNVLYDNTFDRESVESWIKGTGPQATGVTVPSDKELKDMILPKPNNLLGQMPLFDPQRLYQSADRMSGVSESLRGGQYKTNTTNKAIEDYQQSSTVRLDAKSDAVEDMLGSVLHGIGFLCLQFMQQDEVAAVLGPERAEGWKTFTSKELKGTFNVQVAAGSTQKPTSEAKKKQAVEIGKILGPYVQFAPGVVIETTLKLLNSAFDELTLPPDLFERVLQETQTAMRRGSSDVGGGPEQQGAPSPAGGPPPPTGAGGPQLPPPSAPPPMQQPPQQLPLPGMMQPPMAGMPSQNPDDQLQQVAALIDAMPPAAKVAFGNALAKGAPVAEVLPMILQALTQAQMPQQ